jgi:hypothetical protein
VALLEQRLADHDDQILLLEDPHGRQSESHRRKPPQGGRNVLVDGPPRSEAP